MPEWAKIDALLGERRVVTPRQRDLFRDRDLAQDGVEYTLTQADIGSSYRHTDLLFQVHRNQEVANGGPYEHQYTSSDPASPYLEMYAENDGTRVYYHADVSAPFTYKHIFIDVDASATTGYAIGGVGAEYLIGNGSLYVQTEPGWRWNRVASANLVVNGVDHDWWIERARIGVPDGSPVMRVVFQANGNASTFVAPVYTHRFSR